MNLCLTRCLRGWWVSWRLEGQPGWSLKWSKTVRLLVALSSSLANLGRARQLLLWVSFCIFFHDWSHLKRRIKLQGLINALEVELTTITIVSKIYVSKLQSRCKITSALCLLYRYCPVSWPWHTFHCSVWKWDFLSRDEQDRSSESGLPQSHRSQDKVSEASIRSSLKTKNNLQTCNMHIVTLALWHIKGG